MLTVNEVDDARRPNSLSSPSTSRARLTASDSSLLNSDKKGRFVGSRKRKAQDENTSKLRLKRLRGYYNDDYRKLLNDTIDTIEKTVVPDELKPLRQSQVGITIWSQKEKEVFFSVLTTKGRDDLPCIAAKIGTKSELEVRVYLQLLQKATTEHHLYGRRQQLLGLSDMVGAFEVRKTCCDALDLAADALCVLQEKKEQGSETEKYGELGLLNAGSAQWVEDHLHKGEDGESEVSQVLPAAELLNLKSFLELSARLFMNSTDWEYNWHSYSGKDESPSILYTAFADIHDIAINVTKRLIQSSLFFALSRLRAMDSSNYTQQRHVRRRDVTAALNVLGVKRDANSYWVGVARRCHLDVYEDIKRKTVKGEKLSYEEIERRLSQPRKYKRKSDVTTPQRNDPSSPDSVHEHDPPISDYPSEGISDVTASPYDSGFSHRSRKNHASAQECLEQDLDAYAEALDLEASRDEEQRLWKLLGEKSPENDNLEGKEPSKKPGANRKSREDLDDWRSWVDYVGEWEAHDMPVSASEFAATQRKGRRTRPFTTSIERVSTSILADGSDNDDDGRSGDQMVLEDSSGSDVYGGEHEILAATDIEDLSNRGTIRFEDHNEISDESVSSTSTNEVERAGQEQDGSDSGRNSASVSEGAEDQDSETFNTREEENCNASDGSKDSDVESRTNGSTDDE